MISLNNVSKVFSTARGEVRALDNLSLTIDSVDFVAIRGASGCGKSTLLGLIGGLALPTEGVVEVDGLAVSGMSSAERASFRAKNIGFVFQMFHLLPYLNVMQNVLTAAPANTPMVRTRAEELLHQFGLVDRLGHCPGELSAGERQRTAMARAFLNNPRIILADEPTGNLDPQNADIIMEHLRQYHDSGGTIVLVTHDDKSAGYAKRVIELDRIDAGSEV
ncbi:MAG: putative ABC transport system ATP-binding protein [Pirellulaceae bacterium]|jgi:putative ABC transport system ATP-binding protein